MDLHRETRYPFDPEAVFAMLTDEAFLSRRAERAHALSHEAEATRNGAGVRTRLRQSLPAQVPDFLRKFVGQSIVLVEVVEWEPPAADRSYRGTLNVEVSGAPVTLRGTIRLALADGGTLQTVEAKLKASVPMIGRKVEEAAAPAVIAGLDQMAEIGKTWNHS